ncbi:A/G-specific adenine glycosylase [Sutterella sp.]|uniref:A/G-specific adenine glycosylase n=1 Tax=Sutterella sp. TaxID=1981025 RepID=UPI0026DF8369|nr:A/G-specific adenine glycosylase [Sutterella sp.]MDO5530710.1 A/G-specific adenine glycosylase [Sutterella sp.]
MSNSDFARTLAAWQRENGRRDLPWQAYSTPYERLVSEVMLQQTQVETVIPYYLRFLERFPTVEALADAPEDDLMRHWAGLGYYARARNLQRAAQDVVHLHGGRFPGTAEGLETLPGVGPSTAAAVAAFTTGEAVSPMVDGNVKRVLARIHAIRGRVGEKDFEAAVGAAARAALPGSADIAAYTQGLMDLGSLVCRKKSPACGECPVRDFCRARVLGTPEAFPQPKRPLVKTERRLLVGVPVSRAGVWLTRGTDTIWQGLWVPVVRETPLSEVNFGLSAADFGLDGSWRARSLGTMKRELTHQRLFIEAAVLECDSGDLSLKGFTAFPRDPAAWPGMPTPVRRLVMKALDGED